MTNFLYICTLLTIFSIFLIIYAWTLPLFPQEWREKVNSDKNSLNPKKNNESITSFLIARLLNAEIFLTITYHKLKV